MSAEFQFVEFNLSSTSVHGQQKVFRRGQFQTETGLGPWLNSRSHSTRCRRSLWMGSAGGKTSQLTRDKQSVSHSATPFPSKSNRKRTEFSFQSQSQLVPTSLKSQMKIDFWCSLRLWTKKKVAPANLVGHFESWPRVHLSEMEPYQVGAVPVALVVELLFASGDFPAEYERRALKGYLDVFISNSSRATPVTCVQRLYNKYNAVSVNKNSITRCYAPRALGSRTVGSIGANFCQYLSRFLLLFAILFD